MHMLVYRLDNPESAKFMADVTTQSEKEKEKNSSRDPEFVSWRGVRESVCSAPLGDSSWCVVLDSLVYMQRLLK